MLVQKASSPGEEERRWEDFWDTLDFIRLQLEAPLQCSFTAVFEKLLPIRERLALPGATARARITGGRPFLSGLELLTGRTMCFMQISWISIGGSLLGMERRLTSSR